MCYYLKKITSLVLIQTLMSKKGKAKNTINKAKHTKLMDQKVSKIKLEKKRNKERLKAIIKKANESKTNKS